MRDATDRQARQLALFKALQHPLRRGVLTYLQEHRTGTAAEIAGALDATSNMLHCHTRVLSSLGLIEEVTRIGARGATARVFQTTQRFREATVAMLSEEIVQLAAIAYPDIGPSAIAVLDRQAVGELSNEMERLFARVDELRAHTAARAYRSRSALPTVAVAVLYAIGRRTES